ncbi:hypothetical protein [Bdellovibrio sp. HCB337]|uniref:hypothetical protein n=1 Tax=Bdellovibrio sp. HCB337 TaxID=3394358 RepID=UPI0039A48CCD
MKIFKRQKPKPVSYVIPAWAMHVVLGIGLVNMFFGTVRIDVVYSIILTAVIQKALDSKGQVISEEMSPGLKKKMTYMHWVVVAVLVSISLFIEPLDKLFAVK